MDVGSWSGHDGYEPRLRVLAGYHAFHATRADRLRRLSRSQESRAAYDRHRAGRPHR